MIEVLTGFAAGGLHVFSGVDHLAALAPIALQDRGKASRIGAFWGFGHGLGVVVIGGLGLALRGFFDVERFSEWAEFGVGFLLVGVGLWAIAQQSKLRLHSHPHEHEDEEHHHLHAHSEPGRTHEHAALGVGALHGLAGSGHLFGVLPALALPTGLAVAYLASYLVAAVLAMSAFAFGLGVVAKKSGSGWIKRLILTSGIAAIVVGVVWIVAAWPF